MQVAFAQINPTVGDLAGNAELILGEIKSAQARGCRLVVFPEMSLVGYPPEDLLLKPAFISDNLKTLKALAHQVGSTAAVVGFVDVKGGRRYNAAAWIQSGRIRTIYHKGCLPNYGVFDEQRYFEAGHQPAVMELDGFRIGLTICEDIWRGTEPLKGLKARRPDLVLNISASPFHTGKLPERYVVAKQASRFLNAPLLYCNMLGGQDELVFDGGGFIALPNGRILGRAPQFKAGLYPFQILKAGRKVTIETPGPSFKRLGQTEEILEALILGIRDYVQKNGFETVALGLSGGIDSALVVALAVEALGPERVVGVMMPSRFNVSETRRDAKQLAQNLGIRSIEIGIQSIFEEFLKALSPVFKGSAPNIAEENLQARIRGCLLMALSNKFNWLVLTTGNKSEVSTGYCTLYGDTAGGFAVLKDVLKTTVYELARLLNKRHERELIPETIFTRPPTAELKDNQRDEDSLGPYAELDPLIVGYVENNQSLAQLVKKGSSDPAYVQRILTMIDRNEYKRRQAPPGIKITVRSFGRDHRMPITNRYKPGV